MTVKLLLFIMDHLHWVQLGVLALVGAIASQTSITLAVVPVIACGVVITAFLLVRRGGGRVGCVRAKYPV